MLMKMESLLLKAARKENIPPGEVLAVCNHCKDDIHHATLTTQLELLATAMSNFKKPTLHDVRDYLLSLSQVQRRSMSEICTLVKLILIAPATNSISERSASVLRRIKTYLLSTMTQERLNHLMLLYGYKERTDGLQLGKVLQEFVDGSEHRANVFGKFI